LQQHLDDAGRSGEVTIDLEWWVGIEQVGIGAAMLVTRFGQPEQVAEQGIRVVAV
jgi:hypothetical protein